MMHLAVDHDIQHRDDTVRLGVWMFLATVAMLFAAFASAYIVRRSSADWTRIQLPAVLWLNTAVLTLSSAILELAHAAGARRRWTVASAAFGTSLALGVGFLLGQLVAWEQLLAAGVSMPLSPHGAFFYLLTAAHAVHVIAALAVLAWATWRTWSGVGRRDRGRWTADVGVARTCWHFLLGVWLFVFALMELY